jgi:hypothetical protein
MSIRVCDLDKKEIVRFDGEVHPNNAPEHESDFFLLMRAWSYADKAGYSVEALIKARTSVGMCARACIRVRVCAHVCACVNVYKCMCVCVCVCV